jgi:hypothetical protein
MTANLNSILHFIKSLSTLHQKMVKGQEKKGVDLFDLRQMSAPFFKNWC